MKFKQEQEKARFTTAVVGGTTFDSSKGSDFLKKHGFASVPINISEDPDEQSSLYRDREKLRSRIEERLQDHKPEELIIYCNSLSFVVNWKGLYPGDIYELTSYYTEILQSAKLNKLAIVVADPSTVQNLRSFAESRGICKAEDLNIFSHLEFIKQLEQSDEQAQYEQVLNLVMQYKEAGYDEVLFGCTHLDDPRFSEMKDVKVYQPGLIMLQDFMASRDH